jgi:hypothetical protein
MKDAVLRISFASAENGIKGILLHAINEDAKQFYRKCGFVESIVEENLLMAPLKQIAAELRRGPAP